MDDVGILIEKYREAKRKNDREQMKEIFTRWGEKVLTRELDWDALENYLLKKGYRDFILEQLRNFLFGGCRWYSGQPYEIIVSNILILGIDGTFYPGPYFPDPFDPAELES